MAETGPEKGITESVTVTMARLLSRSDRDAGGFPLLSFITEKKVPFLKDFFNQKKTLK